MISAPPQPPTSTPDLHPAERIGGLRVMVLRVGARCVALDATRAREVAPRPAATRLPGAPSIVSGIVNVRGSLVPLVDFGVLLGSGPAATTGWLVTLELGGRRCALALDALPVLRVADLLPMDAPIRHACLPAEVRVHGGTLPLLDVDALADDVLLS